MDVFDVWFSCGICRHQHLLKASGSSRLKDGALRGGRGRTKWRWRWYSDHMEEKARKGFCIILSDYSREIGGRRTACLVK